MQTPNGDKLKFQQRCLATEKKYILTNKNGKRVCSFDLPLPANKAKHNACKLRLSGSIKSRQKYRKSAYSTAILNSRYFVKVRWLQIVVFFGLSSFFLVLGCLAALNYFCQVDKLYKGKERIYVHLRKQISYISLHLIKSCLLVKTRQDFGRRRHFFGLFRHRCHWLTTLNKLRWGPPKPHMPAVASAIVNFWVSLAFGSFSVA